MDSNADPYNTVSRVPKRTEIRHFMFSDLPIKYFRPAVRHKLRMFVGCNRIETTTGLRRLQCAGRFQRPDKIRWPMLVVERLLYDNAGAMPAGEKRAEKHG